MTLAQRKVLTEYLSDMSRRIEHVYYLRGGTSSQETMTIQFTYWRRDGSGRRITQSWDESGKLSYASEVEVKT